MTLRSRLEELIGSRVELYTLESSAPVNGAIAKVAGDYIEVASQRGAAILPLGAIAAVYVLDEEVADIGEAIGGTDA